MFWTGALLAHPQVQAAVHALAARLLERAHLDGAEVTRIIEKALDGIDPGAGP